MNNDTNNNFNGEVLGSVNPIQNEQPNSNVQTEVLGSVNEPNNIGVNKEVGGEVMGYTSVSPTEEVPGPIPNPSVQVPPVVENIPNNVNSTNNVINPTPLNVNTPASNSNLVMNSVGTSNISSNNQPNSEPQAFTNPNNINPMPGFEPSGNIGTTPPISLANEKEPKKKPNSVLFIILIVLILAAVGFGVYYVLNYTDLIKKNSQVSVVTNNIEIKVGETLSTNIDDYAKITGTDTKNCNLDVSEVDVNKAGAYSFKVSCGENIKSGVVTVIDDRELTVKTKTVYKTKGNTITASEFIENPESSLTYAFVNEDEVGTILNGNSGKYTVKILVSDVNNKNTTIDGTLVVLDYSVKGNLVCSSKEQNIDNSTKMIVTNSFIIVDDGNNGFSGISTEKHTFKFSDETAYNNYKEQAKNNSTLTINNISGKPVFDDSSLSIEITNDRDSSSLNSEYGNNVLQNYSSIRTYFTTTLGFTCSFERNS